MPSKPPYSAFAVANWFIEHVPGITPLKLQKLIYFAHGWHLALKEQPLILEPIQAWDYGPVVQSVYHEFKRFGKSPIPWGSLGTFAEFDQNGELLEETPLIPNEDQDTHKFLERIASVLGKLSGLQLSAATHKDGTPWAEIKAEFPNRKYVEIPDAKIKKYFMDVAGKNA